MQDSSEWPVFKYQCQGQFIVDLRRTADTSATSSYELQGPLANKLDLAQHLAHSIEPSSCNVWLIKYMLVDTLFL